MRRALIGFGLAAALAVALPLGALALTVSGDYDSVRIDSQASEVVVRGHVTCDAGATGTVTAFLIQGSREDGGTEPISCTGSQTSWEVRIPLGSPPFQKGKAILEFGWTVTDGTGTIASGRSVEVKIRKK